MGNSGGSPDRATAHAQTQIRGVSALHIPGLSSVVQPAWNGLCRPLSHGVAEAISNFRQPVGGKSSGADMRLDDATRY
jgi:hypothetical protein